MALQDPAGLTVSSGTSPPLEQATVRSQVRRGTTTTFADAVRSALGKLLVLSGRASRREFWSFALVLVIVIFVVAFAIRLLAPDLQVALVIPVVLGSYLAIWAVAVRRLHDANMSGFMLLVAFVPLVGLITAAILLAKAGDPATNAYGPSPTSAT